MRLPSLSVQGGRELQWGGCWLRRTLGVMCADMGDVAWRFGDQRERAGGCGEMGMLPRRLQGRGGRTGRDPGTQPGPTLPHPAGSPSTPTSAMSTAGS